MPREFPIDHPAILENEIGKIVRQIYEVSIPAVIAEIRASHPRVNRRRLIAAARSGITAVNLERELTALGEKTEASWARQISSLLGEDIPRVTNELSRVRKAWVRETAVSIRRGITGATSDSMTRHDGIMSLVDIAVASLEFSTESVTQAVSAFSSRATQSVRGAISRAKSASYRYGGIVNGILQRAFGRTQYKWRTRRDSRVRPSHARLEGTTQRWDRPPVINATGARGHPGDDYNCRCIALPA